MMHPREMREHLRAEHGFPAVWDSRDDYHFMLGVHHGLHVGEGRHGSESHLHGVAADNAEPEPVR